MLTNVFVFCRCKDGAFVKYGSEFHECSMFFFAAEAAGGRVDGKVVP